ncbi:protein TolR [Halorhodospira abdelmalekii]|uniref:protein TolR n=1 Tax=Halorhodospira abdelmalekii TaxID=421629 RepID=UPI001906D3CB|nr:protein TolR [Halorhodospira abdelmalekii]MBK1734705.1 protein TolR [Halorhodospira abdelmalekii]
MARVTPTGARRTRRRPMSEINVVPYIDVMLVLLVIFMVTAPLLYHGIDLDLPQVASEPLEDEEREPLIVSLDTDGRVYLNVADDPEQAMGRDELLETIGRILRDQPNRRVLLRGDRKVEYGDVVALMAQLRQAGVRSVGLMSEPPAGSTPGAG